MISYIILLKGAFDFDWMIKIMNEISSIFPKNTGKRVGLHSI